MTVKENKFEIKKILQELPVQYFVIQEVKHDYSKLIRMASSKKYGSDSMICRRFYRPISKL
jgi:hypothetical protein